MRRRQAIGAIGAILAAAVAPALIPKERLMSLKAIREVTDAEVGQYAPLNGQYAWGHGWDYGNKVKYFGGWKFAYTKDGRDYYQPIHPALKDHGNLGVAPTPAEMDMLNIDPKFARPVFVPNENQFVDHISKKINLLEEQWDAWNHEKQKPISTAKLLELAEQGKYLPGMAPSGDYRIPGKSNG